MRAYQILRVGEIDKGLWEALFEKLSKYQSEIDEVWFFTQAKHNIESVANIRKFLEEIKPYFQRIEDLGIKVGIDVLCTVGHHGECKDSDFSRLDPFDDNPSLGKICTSSSRNMEYIKEIYKCVAEVSPYAIYSDDDLDYSFCTCKKCMDKFKKEYLRDVDTDGVTADEILNYSNPETCGIIRSRWIDFNRDRITNIHKTIESAVHGVNPDIRLGFMTCLEGVNGCGEDIWARTLGCEHTPVIQRPGGGAWTDNIEDVIKKTNKIGRQIASLPRDNCNAYSEIENFPSMSLSKSRKIVGLEALLYIAAGCTGSTFNVLAMSKMSNLDEYDAMFEEIKRIKAPSDALCEIFGKKAADGIGPMWSAKSFAPDTGEYSVEQPLCEFDEFYKIGLPIAYEPEHMSVYLFNGELAKTASDEELKKALSKGVYLDSEALNVINNRGFGEYTGFKCGEIEERNLIECDLEHPFNLSGGWTRNARQSFGYAPFAAAIEKTDEKSVLLAELMEYDGAKTGLACGGIFENALGGRVCVWSYAPYTMSWSKKRTYQLKNIIKWLSKDKLDAYIDSHEKMMLWTRGSGVILANISYDDIENGVLAAKGLTDKSELSIYSGKDITQSIIEKIGEKGEYSLYKLPVIPSFSVAWISM